MKTSIDIIPSKTIITGKRKKKKTIPLKFYRNCLKVIEQMKTYLLGGKNLLNLSNNNESL